jgi:hypothetical protein
VLELGRARQVKAVQKRTGIEPDCTLKLARRNRFLEGDQVTRDRRRIQS